MITDKTRTLLNACIDRHPHMTIGEIVTAAARLGGWHSIDHVTGDLTDGLQRLLDSDGRWADGMPPVWKRLGHLTLACWERIGPGAWDLLGREGSTTRTVATSRPDGWWVKYPGVEYSGADVGLTAREHCVEALVNEGAVWSDYAGDRLVHTTIADESLLRRHAESPRIHLLDGAALNVRRTIEYTDRGPRRAEFVLTTDGKWYAWDDLLPRIDWIEFTDTIPF